MKSAIAQTDNLNMDCPGALPSRMLTEADLDHRSLLRRWLDALVASRARRVLCMLSGLWLINLFDLVLTLLAHAQGMLDESNPIARRLLPLGPEVVAAFKLLLVGGSSAVLIRFRTRFIAEISAALMLLLYTGVA
ncbi:MAG: DUF5658 family protein, partial [Planctomycetota bacterium]